MAIKTFIPLCVAFLVGCGTLSTSLPNSTSLPVQQPAENPSGDQPAEEGPQAVEDVPKASLVPRLMSEPSGNERLAGITQGAPAPFSGILLNDAAAAWLESEPDAVQERCQAFVDRRTGEFRARLSSETQRLLLRIQTIQQINAIEIRARDQRIGSLEEVNETLRTQTPGNWWENALWVGGALLVGIAGGLIAGLLAI